MSHTHKWDFVRTVFYTKRVASKILYPCLLLCSLFSVKRRRWNIRCRTRCVRTVGSKFWLDTGKLVQVLSKKSSHENWRSSHTVYLSVQVPLPALRPSPKRNVEEPQFKSNSIKNGNDRNHHACVGCPESRNFCRLPPTIEMSWDFKSTRWAIQVGACRLGYRGDGCRSWLVTVPTPLHPKRVATTPISPIL
jgi:hypothetical protein